MEEKPTHGYFVISLDFELFWGMFDKETIASYGARIVGERTAIPKMLSLFEFHTIHATWATVGMLMARNKTELVTTLPPTHLQPTYADPRISAYVYMQNTSIGDNEETDSYHYGSSLINLIISTPHQEIGNHTFSHYYCLDGNQNPPEIFARDLEAWRGIARTYSIEATSIVFPRNQMDEASLRICAKAGITAYRGNETHFLYRPRKDEEQTLWIRGLRLLDHYINISGHHTYPLPKAVGNLPMNIPASRFFRPWSSTLRFFEWLRIRRIKKSMTHAAKQGEVFHLWWHPHNVSIDQEQNFKNLRDILVHFEKLRTIYRFQSASMSDLEQITHKYENAS